MILSSLNYDLTFIQVGIKELRQRECAKVCS